MNKSDKHAIGFRTYITVWICLLLFTGMTVSVANLNLGKYGSLTSVLIATLKAVMILLFFMHLKYEKPLIMLMLLVTVCTMAVIIGLTFFDIGFRY